MLLDQVVPPASRNENLVSYFFFLPPIIHLQQHHFTNNEKTRKNYVFDGAMINYYVLRADHFA